ncbi:MAPEG family protein [Haliangium sp.]|uniref:MAPEG family protein n=1 Tax=Haliangium sp. TaxID=2663208 RepID=UPI003D100227
MELTIELRMLVYTGLLGFITSFIYLGGRMMTKGGMAWGIGNRDQAIEFPAWAERAQRAHANFTENLAPFAILVVVAHLIGVHNDLTALGARMFFWARVGHIVVYTVGIPYLRTLVFFAGTAGEIIILLQIL